MHCIVLHCIPPLLQVRLGAHNIVPNYFEQNQAEALDLNMSVLDTLVTSAPDAKINDLKQLLGRMLFSGNAMDKKVRGCCCFGHMFRRGGMKGGRGACIVLHAGLWQRHGQGGARLLRFEGYLFLGGGGQRRGGNARKLYLLCVDVCWLHMLHGCCASGGAMNIRCSGC